MPTTRANEKTASPDSEGREGGRVSTKSGHLQPTATVKSSDVSVLTSRIVHDQIIPARFTAFDEDAIHAFRTIPGNGTVLLLTPVVQHPLTSGLQDENVDPFEPFGRALSQHHKKIRHVPYLPGKNLSETHMEFLQRSSAVIMVCCEPTSSLQSASQVSSRSPSLDAQVFNGQRRVASQVHQVLQARPGQGSEHKDVALIAVGTGPPGCLLDQGIGFDGFSTVAYCPYETGAMEQVAGMLYAV